MGEKTQKTENFQKNKEKQIARKINLIITRLPEECRKYLRTKNTIISASSILAYAYDLQIFFDWYAEHATATLSTDMTAKLTLDDIRLVTVDDIENYMQSATERINTKTRLRQLNALNGFLNYEVVHEHIEKNPCASYNRPRIKDAPVIVTLTDDEVSAILSAVSSGCGFTPHQRKYNKHVIYRDYTIIYLLLMTGIRVSECEGLNISDVNVNERYMIVFRKGGRSQQIPIPDALALYLTEYLSIRTAIQGVSEAHQNALFLSTRLTRLGKASIEQIVEKYARAAGINKPITPHKLRKTYGTELYRHTHDIYLVARALGHRNVDTTTKHYVTQNYDTLADSISGFDYGDN